MSEKLKYQNPYYIYPPENRTGLPNKNRPVLLSDELAKAAMQGMMVNYGPEDDFSLQDIARISYEIAEEMLKARHEFMKKQKAHKSTDLDSKLKGSSKSQAEILHG